MERLSARHSSGGTMMKLPLELLYDIFSSLDFESLAKLRLVGYVIKQTVEAMPAFKCLVEHAPTALCALRESKLISEFSAVQLYHVLITDRCVGCADYGPYLLLPTIERCCFNCLTDNDSLRVINTSGAASTFALSTRYISRIPRMYSIAGKRSSAAQKTVAHKRRDWAFRQENGSYSPFPERPVLSNELLESPEHGDDSWYMASTPFPSLNHQAGSAERGLWCQGCFHQPSVRKAFSKQEMLDHIEDCPGAQRLWSAAFNVTEKSHA
ncbi:hypothetical protein GJ744_002088 [Endocarpon pusillum]|uniref:F-box domain-containing protein n=1 Tax=Endocarpon pusillum TaxID=364733 RepID=A0A8H7A9E1_9EURO|nr:hypothetical protein GJ744_002088 [Endocarpon pusillum]